MNLSRLGGIEVEVNEIVLISSIVGVSAQTIGVAIQGYQAFKKTNIEKFFEKLSKSDKDLSAIGKREDLQRYFFKIIDNVSKEANLEKLDSWKNAVIRLATDFSDYDYKDTFIVTLSQLTVFDLTILFIIYSRDFKSEDIKSELFELCQHKGYDLDLVRHSIIRLASFNLVEEKSRHQMTYGVYLDSFCYVKNNLGKKFLSFVSEF
jgi:hypothetical protein